MIYTHAHQPQVAGQMVTAAEPVDAPNLSLDEKRNVVADAGDRGEELGPLVLAAHIGKPS